VAGETVDEAGVGQSLLKGRLTIIRERNRWSLRDSRLETAQQAAVLPLARFAGGPTAISCRNPRRVQRE